MPKIYTEEGAEVRGDKLYVSCRKAPPKWEKERRTGQHHAFSCVIKMDARARILRKYTSTSE